NLGSAQYSGELDIKIGGTTAGSEYDQLSHILAGGGAQLGGTLNVSLINSFSPQQGDVFQILTATSGISGTFASTVLPALSGNLFWNVVYNPNDVELQVEITGLPGDFNGDGVVDAADYVVWRKGF